MLALPAPKIGLAWHPLRASGCSKSTPGRTMPAGARPSALTPRAHTSRRGHHCVGAGETHELAVGAAAVASDDLHGGAHLCARARDSLPEIQLRSRAGLRNALRCNISDQPRMCALTCTHTCVRTRFSSPHPQHQETAAGRNQHACRPEEPQPKKQSPCLSRIAHATARGGVTPQTRTGTPPHRVQPPPGAIPAQGATQG